MEKNKNKWVGKIIVLVLLAASVGSYYVFPSVKHVMNQVFKMFASGDFTVVRDFVASYGAYAAVIGTAITRPREITKRFVNAITK